MKLALAFLFCVAPFLVLATPEDNWQEWKLKHGKVYRSAEEPRRMSIWRQHMDEVKKHNEEYAKGLHTYTLGENQFCDLTWEEFSELYLGASVPNTGRDVNNAYEPTYRAIPDVVDLRQRGHVTPVKDQGSCGSCWSFASIVALEGAFYQATGTLESLSEQQILGCANGGSYGNQGCKGGWMNPCFQYVKDIGGIQSDRTLPYTGTDDKCLHDPSKFVRSITGNQATPYKNIPLKNYQAIREVVDSGIPVVIAVYVESTFQKYSGGIYGRAISAFEAIFNLNHAITVIGYDYSDPKNPHFIVKNSWGTRWGANGYILLKGEQDTAGLGQKASYPLVI